MITFSGRSCASCEALPSAVSGCCFFHCFHSCRYGTSRRCRYGTSRPARLSCVCWCLTFSSSAAAIALCCQPLRTAVHGASYASTCLSHSVAVWCPLCSAGHYFYKQLASSINVRTGRCYIRESTVKLALVTPNFGCCFRFF